MARSKLTPHRRIEKNRQRQVTISESLQAQARLVLSDYPPTEVFTSTEGVRGEVLRLGKVSNNCRPQSDLPSDEDEAPRHTHVLFLPGNPGVIEYYRPLLRMIYERFPQDVRERVTVHGIGLPGHDLRELNGVNTYVIADHITFCRSYLQSDEMRPALDRSQLVIIGHSYGSYLAVRLIDEMGPGTVRRSSTVLLMPALHYMGQCVGAISRFLLQDRAWTTTSVAWGLTALLPPIVRDTLINLQGHCSGVADISKAIIDGRRRGLYLNICSLARDEILSILEPSTLKAAKAVGSRSLLVHADEDRWCPPAAIDSIRDAFGHKLQTEWAGDGVRHAFVLSTEQTEKVVRILSPWISEKVRRSQSG